MNKKACDKCETKTSDSFYTKKLKCGHEKYFCLDCLTELHGNELCSECSSLKCFDCEATISVQKTDTYKKINFENCETKTHSVAVCETCTNKKSSKLVAEIQPTCFLCYVDLKAKSYLYYTEELNCEKKHKVNLCGKCRDIFTKVEKRCPACVPLKPNRNYCVACYNEVDINLSILPIQCNNDLHKFNICMNCTENLDNPYLICRLCQNKNEQNYAVFKTCEDTYNQIGLLGFKFISNKIIKESIEIDKFVCPECHPMTVKPYIIKNQNIDDELPFWFNPNASVCKFGDNYLLSGGYNIEFGTSLDSSYLVRFERDGRFKYYTAELNPAVMNKKRHSHGSYYDKSNNTLYVFGGASIVKKNEIEFLNSIEIMLVNADKLHVVADNLNEWQSTGMKLKKPRCNFTTIELGNKLYLFGGFEDINKVCNSIEIVNFGNSSTLLVDLKQSSCPLPLNPVLDSKGKDIIIYGGTDGRKQLNTIIKFDTSSHELKKVGEMTATMAGKLRSLKVEGELYIFSGCIFGKLEKPNPQLFSYIKVSNSGVSEKTIVDTKIEDLEEEWHQEKLLDHFNGMEFDFKVYSR